MGLLGLLAALLLSAVACAAAAGELAIQVSCDEFQNAPQVAREVELRVGDSVKLALCSNPSTGFKWESAAISDPSVLQQVDYRLEPAAAEAVGAAGREEWTFKATKAGSSSVSLEYSRPWAGGEKAVWSFALKVVAR